MLIFLRFYNLPPKTCHLKLLLLPFLRTVRCALRTPCVFFSQTIINEVLAYESY